MKKGFFAISLLFATSLCFGENASPLQYIRTDQAPDPFGAYSQAVSVDLQKGHLVFVAGQVAKNPVTHHTIENDIQLATRQTLDNIAVILKAAGTDLDHVIRMDVFLRDIKDWNGMNKEYAKHFTTGHYPVRQAVQVGMVDRIEISCIAYAPNQ